MSDYEQSPIALKWRSKWLRRIVVCSAGLGVAIISLGLFEHYVLAGVSVTVQNKGPGPLRSVVLQLTGNPVELGDIASGAFAQGTVYPEGDSSLEIEFTGVDDKPHRLDVDCYLERGYRGVIRTAIRDARLDKLHQQIDVRPRPY